MILDQKTSTECKKKQNSQTVLKGSLKNYLTFTKAS